MNGPFGSIVAAAMLLLAASTPAAAADQEMVLREAQRLKDIKIEGYKVCRDLRLDKSQKDMVLCANLGICSEDAPSCLTRVGRWHKDAAARLATNSEQYFSTMKGGRVDRMRRFPSVPMLDERMEKWSVD